MKRRLNYKDDPDYVEYGRDESFYPPLIFSNRGHFQEDDGSIENDENGDPTPEQLKRWTEDFAALKQKIIDDLNAEFPYDPNEEEAEPEPPLRYADFLKTYDAGRKTLPPKRNSRNAAGERQLGLFDDHETPTPEQSAADNDAESLENDES